MSGGDRFAEGTYTYRVLDSTAPLEGGYCRCERGPRVNTKYKSTVDGLCGFYDGDATNERRKPDGAYAASIDEFAQAWAKPGLRPDACEIKIIPPEKQKRAWDLCDVILKEPISRCGQVLNLDKWRSICLEKICECTELVVNGSRRSDEECRCAFLEALVAQCLAGSDTDLADWRLQMDCPADCPAPLVHYDCYRRRCEPACSSIGDPRRACPAEDGQCFPGCYCPPGTLRRGDSCVTPQDCLDCVCSGVGTPAKYVSFEGDDIPYLGNCTYLASRDRNETGQYKYEVLQKLALWSAERNGGGGAGGVCLAAGMRLAAHHTSAYRLPHVPHRHFAEQLTRMDMELFKRLVPHQCLGAVWSRRDKDRSHDAATVLATVNQFNAVSFRVISTVLVEPGLRPPERADVLAAWLDIARELRVLKNFSSLKAIISGLQSNSVYRLRKTWAVLPKEKSELFDELARIFSEDNNRWAQRELLMREGTAKFADTVGENDRQLQKLLHERGSPGVSHGTIPYLGTFLTDLTMIDTAIPDTVADGLINFDKRRKEFEVLAQIKLLQGAANAYHLPQDPMFDRWFDSVIVLDDREAFQLSCQIEPPTNPPKERRPKKTNDTNGQGHKKNDSIASTSSSNSSQFYCETDGVANAWKRDSLERRSSPTRLSHGSSSSSLPSLDVSLSSANSGQKLVNGKIGGVSPAHPNAHSGPDFYIIRVTYESDNVETEGVVLYKSIMLSNNERTPQVIRNAMLKLNLDGDPDGYTLSQVLPDREMVLPANANVYYAVNTAYNLNFILRPRKSQLETLVNGKARGKRT